MKTYKVQWRLPEFRHALKGDEAWKDFTAEEFLIPEHAQLRKSGYWEKQLPALEFRVVKGDI